MAEEENNEEGQEEEAPKKSKKKLIIILVVVLLVLGGGGAAAAVMLGGGGGGEEGHGEGHEEEIVQYEQVELEPFIVNLSEQSSFLKVRMILEYDPSLLHAEGDHGGGGGYGGGGSGGGGEAANAGGLPHGMLEREPMIKDAIIRVISGKKPEEVLSADGKEELKEELIEAINEAIGLDEAPVTNLYFIEFIVQ